MRTLKLAIAYDGTAYVGWQRQANGVSVQQLLEEAFAPLENGTLRTVAGASRTDAGVHALGQVASIETETDLPPIAVCRAMNVRLPADIRVMSVEEAPPGFHARFTAAMKVYRYRISTRPVLPPFERNFMWHAPEPKNIAAMREAAALLVGRLDFASFQGRNATVRETVRTITRLELLELEGEIQLWCEGDGFLRHMVRIIAGTLAEVGTGLRTAASMRDIVNARDRAAAGTTAPPHGLTLMSVRYESEQGPRAEGKRQK